VGKAWRKGGLLERPVVCPVDGLLIVDDPVKKEDIRSQPIN